jgi:hypothetical protein
MKRLLLAVLLITAPVPVAAQWLNYPTPGIPRSADDKPNLGAPTPRTPNGKPDFTGLWRRGGDPYVSAFQPDPLDVLPWAKDVARRRADEFFKARPSYRCLPSGPEAISGQGFGALKVLQTPNVIAILHEDLTYRQIFMDGRALETAPHPSRMAYSVGRWDGDTLVVDSFGFNDRTWLNSLGLPHTEALRMTERYSRRDFGHIRMDVTFTDSAAYARPLSFVVNLEFVADTEMIETVCEVGSEKWTGSVSQIRSLAIKVAPEVLSTYTGTYSGPYAGRIRTVEVNRIDDELSITALLSADQAALIPQSDTLFISTEGLSYKFVTDQQGVVTDVIEIHAGGDHYYRRHH